MPDSGTISPTLISAGACARAIRDSPTAAAPDSTVRRVSPLDLLCILLSPCSLFCRSSHAEIGLAHAVVGAQRVVVAFKHDVSRLEHITVVGGFQGFRDALLDQQHGQPGLTSDIDQPFE